MWHFFLRDQIKDQKVLRFKHFPPFLELDLGAPVALTLEDSRHYALAGNGDADADLDADAEWESLYPGGSAGFVRLGLQRRFFGLSVYHQMHCLDSLRYAVLGRAHAARRSEGGAAGSGEKGKREVPHAQHCLNYLRQTVLCAADLTLEPEVVRGSLDVGEGLFATHVCRDWSKVHAFVEQNFEEYERWANANASTAR
ncbi:hypothetical protein DFH11DRAFT_1841941 [Phellopilus nigrolimitatus]|nr:hypothetical protein DFH11DRAFT_1841941 [Phellopilus nigrolimitatus]